MRDGGIAPVPHDVTNWARGNVDKGRSDASQESCRRSGARRVRLSYSALVLVALHGGRRFADKTPENSFIVPFLASTFPLAQFVHIVRDGRDAAVSHVEKPWLTAASAASGRRDSTGSSGVPTPGGGWKKIAAKSSPSSLISSGQPGAGGLHEAALDGLAALPSGRAFELRYESVVSDPMGTADVLGEFLGASAAGQEALRTGLARARVDSVGRWRKALDDRENRDVEREIRPLLDRLGYA